MRDQLAMVLEMALVHGQVGAEVHKLFLYDLLLPWFELCLQRGNNGGFNRTRLTETLLALDRDAEGDVMAPRCWQWWVKWHPCKRPTYTDRATAGTASGSWGPTRASPSAKVRLR